MAGQPVRDGARRAIALLASCIVVIMGGLGCTAILVTSGMDAVPAVSILCGSLAAIALTTWVIGLSRPENGAAIRWSWLGRRRRRVEYRLSPRSHAPDRPATPIPEPTAESVRALAGGINTWVPVNGVRPESTRTNG